jgi:hypothetical protein
LFFIDYIFTKLKKVIIFFVYFVGEKKKIIIGVWRKQEFLNTEMTRELGNLILMILTLFVEASIKNAELVLVPVWIKNLIPM